MKDGKLFVVDHELLAVRLALAYTMMLLSFKPQAKDIL